MLDWLGGRSGTSSVALGALRALGVVALAGAVAALACCDRRSDPDASAATVAATPSPTPEPTVDGEPWRYGEELGAATPGLDVVPVLELSAAGRGRAQVVAAVQRPGTPLPPVTVEIWTFEQRGEDLSPAGEPRVLVPTVHDATDDIEDDPTARDELRLARATPGTVLFRPLGLPVKSAADLLPRLAELARAARDPATPAAERANALATLLRGVDDDVLLDGRLATLLDVLSKEPLKLSATESSSERRVRLATTTAPVVTFDVWKEGDGWVLAAFDGK